MLSFFFFTDVFSLHNKWPIKRFTCGAVINSSFYDLHEIADQRSVDTFSVLHDGLNLTYYLKICGSFEYEDVPRYFKNYQYYSFAVCLPVRQICYPLASRYSLDYEPLDEKDFSKGVVLSLDAEPNRAFGEVEDWQVFFIMRCNPNQKDPRINVNPRYSPLHNINMIYYDMEFEGACALPTATPEPTPEYSPQCKFEARDHPIVNRGISMDLNNLNDGPGGHMWYDSINGNPRYVFYQPCERMQNPGDHSDPTLASVWVCTTDLQICKSYGVADDHMTIHRDENDINNPVTITIYGGDNNKKTQITLGCDSGFFDYQLDFKTANISQDGYTLNLLMYSTESCVKSMPAPNPPAGRCLYEEVSTTTKLRFDASDVNSPNEAGYVLEVQTTGLLGDPKRWLHYQPCKGIICPKNAYCDQFEDAYLWLCDDIKTLHDDFSCDPYGLFEKNISMVPYNPEDPFQGVVMKYTGGDRLRSEIRYICDPDMPAGQVTLPNTVQVTQGGQVLTFNVYSRNVCASGQTPVPYPDFYPPRPTKGPTPTPTPLPSPNALMFHSNSTHYILMDLENPDQSLSSAGFVIASQGRLGNIVQYWSPFRDYPCPFGYKCGEFTNASSWTCWTDQQLHQVCFPTGMYRYGVSMSPLNANNLDLGAFLRYKGAYGINLEIRAECVPSMTRDLPLTSQATFHYGSSGSEFSFVSKTSLSCPQMFHKPVQPSYRPTPTPDPKVYEGYTFKVEYNHGEVKWGVDLNKIVGTYTFDVALGYHTYYEFATILYSPVKRVSCLAHYDCQGFEPANIWKCFRDEGGNNKCFPIGDYRYHLEFEDDTPEKGIHLNYHGGLGGYETYISYVCNTSVPSNSIYFDRVGDQTPQKVTILYAHTSQVCPIYKPLINDVTIGAIFLLIFTSSFILYIVIGVGISFFSTGIVSFPNISFWSSFWDYVLTGAAFIGTCGKRISFSTTNYDTI